MESTKKRPNLIIALIPIFSAFLFLYLSLIKFDVDIQIPLILSSLVAALLSKIVLKNSWVDIEKGIINSITNALQAILITCIIGLIIGSWIAGGIVPSIIFYGLKILSPKFFLVTCLFICSIVSITSGSSWTTAGTIGVAMIGIGVSMGFSAALCAGCIISGAYFGDKMSPFSDTTNLAPAVAGTTLFTHIRKMLSTTGISYFITIVIYYIINTRFSSNIQKSNQIETVATILKENFNISPFLLLPLVFLLIIIFFKMPAIPGLIANVAIGVMCAIFVQGQTIGSIGTILSYGFESNTGNAVIDELLSKGGLQNMMWTVSLILCSLTFGGIMHQSEMLAVLSESILKFARSIRSLIIATGFTAILVNLVCGEQYLSILLTGKMYKDEYSARSLPPEILSRTLEDFGTISSPLIPWSTCAVAMATYLNVPTLTYLPYCFFNLLNPIIAIIFAVTGITITKSRHYKSQI